MAAEERVQGRDQLVRLAWPDEAVIAAELEEPDPRGHIVAPGESEDRDVSGDRKLAQPPAHVRARSLVEKQIKDHDVRRCFGRSTNGVVLTARFVDNESRGTRQLPRDGAARRGVVRDDECGYGRDRCQLHLPAVLRGTTDD